MEGKTAPTIPALKAVCDAYGITLSNFFGKNNVVEVTPGTKSVLDNWNYLTKEEKQSIMLIINNYINKRK